MRWVKDGPDIPLELIRAAEDGRLVFFCGAGISQRAGLPSFKGLVEAVYEKLQRQRALFPLEQKAFQECNYDQVFANLESSIKNSNLVRETVAEVLQLRVGADTGTHEALLRLSTDTQGICRLVTTNYDLGFFLHMPASTRIDAAPRLPVPRPGRWNSIVHLHGFLQECGKDWEELILSSADFGAAYLVDGWATRFLRELFRHFIVLFVGYGVNDVVVRYMLQALAVSFAEQGDRPRAFAFAEVENDAESTTLTWRAKGIEPILYAKSDNSHEVLHQSLRVWAEKASGGLMGRRSIAAEYLGHSAPVERNEIVDQVLWALNDGSGATAKFIAELPASPSPRHWLAILDGADFFSFDGVPLVDDGRSGLHSQPVQSVTLGLAQWLCRHLSEADVLDWALTKGGCLNPGFRGLVREALAKGNPIPDEMRKAWDFLARPSFRPGPFSWGNALARHRQMESGDWDLGLKREIAGMLEPYFVLRRDTLKDILRKAGPSESDSYPLKVEIVFADGDDIPWVLNAVRRRPDRDAILSSLLGDCTTYVRRAMEVQEYFGEASSDHDWTYIWVPAIKPISDSHQKPLGRLIALTAECLVAAGRQDARLGRAQVDYWKTIPYPVFRRLVCYGLALPGLFTIGEVLAYILGGDSPLWLYNCQAELCQLLSYVWPSLDPEQSEILIDRILEGPPAELYRDGLSAAELEEYRDWAIADRLAALQRSARSLPSAAGKIFSSLQSKYARPNADIPPDDRVLSKLSTEEAARALAGGLSRENARNEWASMVSDEWDRSLAVLRELAASGKWPVDIWTVVLDRGVSSALSQVPQVPNLISILALLNQAPPEFISGTIRPISQFLEFFPRAAGDLEGTEIYWQVWIRTLSTDYSESLSEAKTVETLADAMNTVSGRLTEALFEWLRRRSVAGKAGVPTGFWEKLGTACNPSSERARGPRCLAAVHLSWLFSENSEWTVSMLLPFFDWQYPDEAKAAWGGFLFGPNIQPDLWPLLRGSFLATFDNTDKLSDEPLRSLYQLFAGIVVHYPDWLTNDECQRIVTKAAHVGRVQIAWVFWRNLEAAEERATSQWKNRIGPWLTACWQPDEHLKDSTISENLVFMALAARDAFPDAVETIEHRLGPVTHVDSTVYEIGRTQAPEKFPAATVKLLDIAIDRHQRFYKPDLADLLARISQNWPEAVRDRRFRSLSDFAAG